MRIGIEVDPAGLRAGLRQAEAETKAAAQKMGAAAQVKPFAGGTGSALFPGVNLPASGGGGAGGIPPIAPAMREAAAETEKVANSLYSITTGLRQFERGVLAVVRGFGLMAVAAKAAESVVSGIYNYFNSAEVAATRFLSSIGEGVGNNAEDRLKTIRQELIKLDQDIDKKSDRSLFGQFKGFLTDDTIGKDIRQQKILQDELRQGEDQARINRANKEKGEREDSHQEALQFQRDADSEARRTEEEHRQQIEKEEDALRDHRIQNAKQITDENNDALGGPLDALKRKTNEQLADLALMRQYGDAFEKVLADAAEKALIAGSSKASKKISDDLANAMRNAIYGALAESGGSGESFLGNQLTLLSELGQKIDAVRSTIQSRMENNN